MPEAHFLVEAVAILAAAVVCVSLFQKIGLGSVLGYLVAGAAIGPGGLGLATNEETLRALADLGVVFLLFMVGLELPLERIRVMRAAIFGLGGAQILVTAAAIAAAAGLLGLPVPAALAVGGGLALSSTAVVLRLIAERGELSSRLGRSGLAVLLMQDLAVGPLLVLVLALGSDAGSLAAAVGLALVKAALALLAILGLGRHLLRPLFWSVAATRLPELFAALTLLIVLCAALATQAAGLSMAFGAFLAGMLLAETHYRHQVAAVIEPFRGLLLGLFFVSVGIGIDLPLLLREPATVLLLCLALLLGKALLLAPLARLFGLPPGQAVQLGILLSQGGEFAFVLLGTGMATGVVPLAAGQTLVLVVAVTMMATPLLALLGRQAARGIARWTVTGVEAMGDEPGRLQDHVIVAGFGRIGAAIAQQLAEAGRPYVAIDLDPARVADGLQQGLPVYYGDAARAEVMEALHVERARAVVVALDNRRAAVQLAALLHYVFPSLKVFARAYDEAHAEELRKVGATVVVPEPVAIGSTLVTSVLAAAAGEGAAEPAAPI